MRIEADRSLSTDGTAFQRSVRHRPLLVFGVLAFALSWTSWLGSHLTSGSVAAMLFFVGGLGPAAAAAVVAWQLGALQPWLGRVRRWRVPPWFYVFAVGFPVVLYATPNAVLALFGGQPDLSLVVTRMPAYAATWVTTVFLGGLEEPGWRGFALPRLQQRYTPVGATLLLGVVWGLWHLPVQPLAIVVTVPLAFLYTWLFNRTGSALLCILLHASLTPAQEHLTLVADSPTVDVVILGTLIAAAAGFVAATHGRLGLEVTDHHTGPAAHTGGRSTTARGGSR